MPALLFLYLRILRIGATFLAVAGGIAAILTVVFGLMMLLRPEIKSGVYSSIVPGIAIGLVSLLEYVATIAGAQFVYVVLDLERHLRLIASRN